MMPVVSKPPSRNVQGESPWLRWLILGLLIFLFFMYCFVQVFLSALFANIKTGSAEIQSGGKAHWPAIASPVAFPQYGMAAVKLEAVLFGDAGLLFDAGRGKEAGDGTLPIEPSAVGADNILFMIRGDENMGGDAFLLLSNHRKNKDIRIVSFSPDAWVPFENGSGRRLNELLARGGPELTVNTINDVFSLDIQNYILLDFSECLALSDVFGGVKVNLTQEEAAYYSGLYDWNVAPGPVILTGNRAALYCRSRDMDPGDLSGAERRSKVLAGLYQKLAGLQNTAMLCEFIVKAADVMETNMSDKEIFSLIAGGGVFTAKNNIPQLAMPAYRTKMTVRDGGKAMLFDIPQNKALLSSFLHEADALDKPLTTWPKMFSANP